MTATTEAPVLFPTTYRDKFGRSWRVRITAGLLGRLRRDAGVDLRRMCRSDKELAGGLARLFADHEQVGRFLWTLVEDQADAAGVSPEDFVGGFDGPTLDRCVSAVLCALAEFAPRSVVAAAAVRGLVEGSPAGG